MFSSLLFMNIHDTIVDFITLQENLYTYFTGSREEKFFFSMKEMYQLSTVAMRERYIQGEMLAWAPCSY